MSISQSINQHVYSKNCQILFIKLKKDIPSVVSTRYLYPLIRSLPSPISIPYLYPQPMYAEKGVKQVIIIDDKLKQSLCKFLHHHNVSRVTREHNFTGAKTRDEITAIKFHDEKNN